MAFNILSIRLLKFRPEIWNQVGRKIVYLVRDDARNGIFQNADGKPTKGTYNKQYAELKANRFKRKTFEQGRGKNRKRIVGTKLGKNKRDEGFVYTNKNKMLKSKAYGSGWRVKNSDVSKVNMELTGATLDSFKAIEPSNNSITMTFGADHEMKIIGNANAPLGRQLVGLNDKNIEVIKKILIKGLKENLSGMTNEEVNILVKL
jgi:hypothetical protein